LGSGEGSSVRSYYVLMRCRVKRTNTRGRKRKRPRTVAGQTSVTLGSQ
jgi:hypothetical protein